MVKSLIEYYEKPNLDILHPSENPKVPKFTKRCYNKLKKIYSGRAKFPEYPKSGKLNKKLEKLFEAFEIPVEYYK